MKIDYNTIAQEYARHRQIHPDVFKKLIQSGELNRASKVLEVGCGTGNYTAALEKAVGCSCWGVDPSEQMLAKAKARCANADFKVGNAQQLAYPTGFFDFVFSVDVIHHVDDRSAYFREAHRVLKKGGQVCTVTDSEEIIRHRQPLSVYFPETIEPELQRYPSIADLQAMMSQAGFLHLQKTQAEFTYSLTDMQRYRDKAFSCLHLIATEAFERGLQRMAHDLRRGVILATPRYVLIWGIK